MSVTKVVIRKAVDDDAAAIAKVSIEAWQESYRGIIDQDILDNLSLEKRIDFRRQILKDNPEGYFVACIDNKVIGFCDAGPSRFDYAKGEIYAIYVLNVYKGKSIGYQLFYAAKLYLSSQNLTPYIAMALSENHTACIFYERQGGTIFGENIYTVEDKSYPEVCYLFK